MKKKERYQKRTKERKSIYPFFFSFWDEGHQKEIFHNEIFARRVSRHITMLIIIFKREILKKASDLKREEGESFG